MRRVAIIGLGRFGLTLARELGASGVEVIAIDRNQHFVDEIKDDVDIAVRLDSTDEEALLSQQINTVDVCVVAIGENFEAALLTASIVKKLGVPQIICRAQTAVHAEIFSRIGADEIIQPETQAGSELARRLAHPQLADCIELSGGYSLIELRAPKPFQNKTLEEIGLRSKYQVNLIMVKRPQGEQGNGNTAPERSYVPQPGEIIRPGDTLVLVGSDSALAELPRE